MIDPPRATPEHVRSVRALLRETGFSAQRIRATLGTEGTKLLELAHAPMHRRRVADAEPRLALLIRLFLLGDTVPAELADQALGDGLAALVATGLLAEDAAEVRAAVRLVPHDDVLIVSDLPGSGGAEHVAGLHGPSALLADLTIRRPAGRALDVGTGNGIQAILAARHTERVVATDVNERALAFAELNCALNDVAVELRHGSFLEPVAGELFDLVVSNPPYVISPETEVLFRDAGLEGDSVSESLVRELPGVLADGGFATVTVSWVHAGGELDARPRSWLEGSGCDAWILHTAVDDPLTTAGAWNRDRAADPEEYDAAIDRWLAYFREQGIEAIAYGSLVLHRRAGGGEIASAQLPRSGVTQASTQLERLFAALADPAEDILERRLRPVPEVRFEQTLRAGDASGWKRVDRTLALDGGLAFAAELDEPSAQLVAALGEGMTVRDAARAAAEALGLDPAAALDAGAELARRLRRLGFLTDA